MELIVLGVVLFLIWAWYDEKKRKEAEALAQAQAQARAQAEAAAEAARLARINDPAWVGMELARTTREGDPQKVQGLIEQLPAWPTRKPLLRAAEWLAVLTHSAGVADAAGVEKEFTDRLRAQVESALIALDAVAVKLISLTHLGHEWKRLDKEPRRSLKDDAQALDKISVAAAAVHRELTEAIARGGRGGGAQALAAEQNLRALANAIQKLSQRNQS
ncbi:hypothetical protein AB5J55_42010 [Streptomyces sp. R11]|uniref:Uncharacterized protein n=1 Tax=Streptomyces sp. R11 TaxID=3238625 RepID=A0AB39NBF0_9ACTN